MSSSPLASKCLMVCRWMVLMGLLACVSGPIPKDIKLAEIQYDLGVNDLRSGRLTDALRNFVEAVRLNPDFPKAQNGLGLVQHMLGRQEEALRHFKRALELDPKYTEVLNNMARVYISQGRFHAAIPLLRKALNDVFLVERYLAESNLGWALFQVGEEEEGFRHVKNSVAQNDRYCVGYEYLGLMYQTRKQYLEAAREFEQLVKLCPEYSKGYQVLGRVLLMLGDLEGGCEALRTCWIRSRMTDLGTECDRLLRMSCPEKPKSQSDSNGSKQGAKD